MNNVKDRLISYIKSKDRTIASFEREIGVSSGYIKNISRSIQPDILENISNIYPELNIEWLIIGKGEMLKSEYSQTNSAMPVANEESIPLVSDLQATCGVPDGFSIAIKKDDCTPLLIPGIKGDFAIRAKGRSMINRQNPEQSINENNIIICNRWNSRSHVRWGEVYALATNDGIVVKQLQPSEKEGFIRCVSFNLEDGFKPYDLPVTEISDWAIVVGVINISMFS
ncbi:S24 family peptidase [Coprobacter sp.]|uniref:S24 family peptidase n=1 Tax=Coprobacter sp. TaxID=1941478 RepID=UPI003AB21AC6